MRKPPRLIADLRRRSIRNQILCIIVCLAAAYGVWRGMEYGSDRLRADGRALISEMEQERDHLSGGAVERVVAIRKMLGMAASSVNEAVKAKHYTFPGDIRGFAETREDERKDEARGYVTQYRTSLERREVLARELKAEIGPEGKKPVIEKRLDAIAKGNGEVIPGVVEELKKASEELNKTLGTLLVIPWNYFWARDAARKTLAKARAAASGVEWIRELAAVEKDAQEFSLRITNGLSEMRKCDEKAETSAKDLLSMPFGGRSLIDECIRKLKEAAQNSRESSAAALSVVNAVKKETLGRIEVMSNRVAEAIATVVDLHQRHGPRFVKKGDLSQIRSCRESFAAKAKSATENVLAAHGEFLGKIERRNESVAEIEKVCIRLRGIPLDDEKTVEQACVEASQLVAEVGAANLGEVISVATNRMVAGQAALNEAVEKVLDLQQKIEGGIPDWDEYSQGFKMDLEQARKDVLEDAEKVSELERRISEMRGERRDEMAERARGLSGRAKELLAELPAELACANGTEAERAEGTVKDCQKRAAAFKRDVDAFQKEFQTAKVKGTIAEIFYENVQQKWTSLMDTGKDLFNFSLKFNSPGKHRVEIIASKSAGQLYLRNKMARAIELRGEVSDASRVLGAGSLEFGNTVAEAEQTLLAFSTEGSAGYHDFTLKLNLGYRSKILDRQSTSDWDVRKLRLKLKVDGVEQDEIFQQKAKEVE